MTTTTSRKIPIYTTLEFFRTKQTINSFEIKYPKSIIGVREAVREALDDIDIEIRELNLKYLNGADNMESFIREKMISLTYLLTETQTPGIYRKYDFEYVCDMAGSSSNIGEHINKVKSISSEITTYCPNGFMHIVNKFEKIIDCMEKYLRSFYKPTFSESSNKYLKSAEVYDLQRRKISDDVKESLKQIFQLSNIFIHQGLKLENLSDNSAYLARRTKCNEVPPLLLFPENCFIIQECKELLEQWLKLDREYLENIRSDIEQLVQDRTELQLSRRDNFEEHIKKSHKYKLLRQEYEKEKQREEIMDKKISQMDDEHTKLIIDQRQLETDLEVVEIPIQTLIQYDDKNSKIQLVKYMTKKENIKAKIKDITTKVEQAEARIENYSHYHENLNKLKKEVENAELDSKKQKFKLQDIDSNLTKLNHVNKQLQTILSLKSSNATLKKIFYNLDFKNRLDFTNDTKETCDESSGLDQIGKQMNLSKAIRITCRYIDKDWSNLYFNLPFYPPRGNNELEYDVAKFTKDQVRGLPIDMATQSLNQWRRLHIRANIASLIMGLDAINRKDIVNKIGRPSDTNQKLINRTKEERQIPKSPSTRFILKHYPHLQQSDDDDDMKKNFVVQF